MMYRINQPQGVMRQTFFISKDPKPSSRTSPRLLYAQVIAHVPVLTKECLE